MSIDIEPVHYHVGIVVPDLEAAQARFTDLLGVTWGQVMEIDAYPFRDGDGNDLTLPNKICYSTTAPHLELIQEVPGTVWECNEHSNLHHIGFWSGSLAAESERLSASLCPLQLCGRGASTGPESFAYHRDPLGVRIELVDAGLRSMIESLYFGGESR